MCSKNRIIPFQGALDARELDRMKAQNASDVQIKEIEFFESVD